MPHKVLEGPHREVKLAWLIANIPPKQQYIESTTQGSRSYVTSNTALGPTTRVSHEMLDSLAVS